MISLANLRKSMYGSAFALIINSVILSGFGFIFWIAAARTYSAEQIGVASALLSSLELITSISLLGANIGLIKFLPTNKNQTKLISSSYLICAAVAFAVSGFFVIFIQMTNQTLGFSSLSFALAFIIISVTYVLFTLADSSLIGLGLTGYILVKSTIFSVIKLVLSFILAFLGSVGLFLASGIGSMIAFIYSLIRLPEKIKLTFDLKIIKHMFKFCFWNYLAQALETFPSYLLPLIINSLINPKTGAYFYVAFMISSIVMIIPKAIARSYLAEGSNVNFSEVAKFTYLLQVPLVVVFILLGKSLLFFFGSEYSYNAYSIFVLLLISTLLYTLNSLFISKNNLLNNFKAVISINLWIFFATIISCILLIRFSLVGIGLGWMIGQAVGNIFVMIGWVRNDLGARNEN